MTYHVCSLEPPVIVTLLLFVMLIFYQCQMFHLHQTPAVDSKKTYSWSTAAEEAGRWKVAALSEAPIAAVSWTGFIGCCLSRR